MDNKVKRQNGTWPAAVVGLVAVGVTSLVDPLVAGAVMAVAGPVVAAVAVRVRVYAQSRGIDIKGGV